MIARKSTRSVPEQIAHKLKSAILSGRFRPGDPLPSERDLAEQYEVNRSSIREAMKRLEASGLVKVRQGGATRVTDFLMSAGLELLPTLIEVGAKVDPEILRDLHDIRAMLLGWCAERAAELADPSSVLRLEDLVRRLSDPKAKPSQLQELDYDFFHELVQISGNKLLMLLSNMVREIYLGGRERFSALYAKDIFDPAHHAAAVAAIRAKDKRRAAQAMRAHAETALRTLPSATAPGRKEAP
ncbi:MAG: FadR/GntR family transcriptional regulator [Myxococcota bacterium]